ncbi:UDP-N-acetylmuramate--L-alanine ligase [Rhodocaloribacter litoris]|uniref:UDP-N-acetylmuramate--L-alanine ligase n=1 Tax=Rhodocaloribacter litoris TaxID=2558931 RepID=UPI00141DC910|nr:UDP-N-acetylmuramate--L-alanine ligase [Rhodocaloribacter litoris]QXD14574.1 UDP-N-acetylmuramate--L-alanine ligase [Rhodocaloribacter litoris]GIV59656.1 MAG: UDP-N-acetylmuramate:L-alanyl-gamma-D-glutamyl-meso-diaminopimelate ligase [Rhodothermaceae bacterium]
MKNIADLPDAHLRIFERPPVPAPDAIEDVYLIGICGTGMGSLAGLFQQAGYRVRGADAGVYPPMSTRLAELGIPVHHGYDAAHLDPAPDLVVVGNACTPQHVEATYAREHGLVQQSLPEALAHFFIRDRRSLVVAGTHGKTTTTSLLVHVLRTAGLDPGFLVGGIMRNGNDSYAVGSGPYFVVEGDEYDSAYFDKRPKFMHYRPTSAVVTSMEFDHADIYASWEDYRDAFRAFVALVPPHGLLALCNDDPEVTALADHTPARVRRYGLAPGADVTARDVRRTEAGQHFTLVVDATAAGELFLPLSGRHNLLNALAVCTLALDEGLSPDRIAAGMASFRGIKRRLEVRGEAAGVLVVDDFAHHPTAVRETIRAARERWPARRLVAVFEPRSNSSRRKVFEQGYTEAFDDADAVFFSTPPFRHNDRPEDFMDMDVLVAGLQRRGVPAGAFPNAGALLPPLLDQLQAGAARTGPTVVLIMSNGSFDNLHERLLTALADRETAPLKPSS